MSCRSNSTLVPLVDEGAPLQPRRGKAQEPSGIALLEDEPVGGLRLAELVQHDAVGAMVLVLQDVEKAL